MITVFKMETYEKFINNILKTRGRFACGTEYHECHHILPRCMGGTDDKDNLIDLFAREHFIAHKLLAQESPDNEKLLYAWWRMCNWQNHNQEFYVPTPEEYEVARKRFSESISGDNNPMKNPLTRIKSSKSHLGYVPTQETRDKLSMSHKGKHSGVDNCMYGQEPWNKGLMWSDDIRKKMSDSWDYSKHVTEEMKQKVSNAMKELWTDERRESYRQKMSGENNPFRIVVYCPELDETFLSMTEAHDKYGICLASISRCIKGKQKYAGKHPVTSENLTWVQLENNIS